VSSLDVKKLPENDPYRKLLLLWQDEDGENFDEDKYYQFCDQFFQKKKFVDFLHHTLCTYPAINDFLIQCLAHANHEQDHFDT